MRFLEYECEQRGWTWTDLAEASGLSRQAINWLSRGKAQTLKDTTADGLARALDCSRAEIQTRYAYWREQEEEHHEKRLIANHAAD